MFWIWFWFVLSISLFNEILLIPLFCIDYLTRKPVYTQRIRWFLQALPSQGINYISLSLFWNIIYPTYFTLKVDVLFWVSSHLTRLVWFTIYLDRKPEGHCSTNLKNKFYCLLNNHMYKKYANLTYPLHNKKNRNRLWNAWK